MSEKAEEPILIESKVSLVAAIDADDVHRGLGKNDELILAFIMDLIEVTESSDMEERLRDRLADRSRGSWERKTEQ